MHLCPSGYKISRVQAAERGSASMSARKGEGAGEDEGGGRGGGGQGDKERPKDNAFTKFYCRNIRSKKVSKSGSLSQCEREGRLLKRQHNPYRHRVVEEGRFHKGFAAEVKDAKV